MKVLYLINTLGAGGAEQSLAELLSPLQGHGIEVTVATLDGRRRAGTTVVERGMETVNCGGRGLLGQVRSVRRVLSARRPDVLHTSLFDADVVGRIAGRLAGVPVLTSLVNTSYDPSRFSDPAVRAWRLKIVQAVDSVTARRLTGHFHAITHAVKASAVSTMRLDPETVTVVERGRSRDRLGFNDPARRRASRDALGLDHGARVIVTVGRQEWQKGQDVLVEAFDIVASRLDDVHLLLVGRPGHASPTVHDAITRSEHRDRIHVLGHRDDVADVVCAADCFAFPSRYEGLGGSLVEAMALRMPIVATRIPAIEEVVEHGSNALLVSPDATTELAAALEQVLVDPALRDRFATRSEQIFAERFTLESSAERMAEMYRSVRGDR